MNMTVSRNVDAFSTLISSSGLPVTYLAGSFWSGDETGLQQPEWQVTCVIVVCEDEAAGTVGHWLIFAEVVSFRKPCLAHFSSSELCPPMLHFS